MRPTISPVLVAVLVLFSTFVSCNNQESINKKTRWFVSPRGGYACDLLNDSIDFSAFIP